MEGNQFKVLFYLLKENFKKEKIDVTTTQIAKTIRISQQSASRILNELEEGGYIRKEVTRDGSEIFITKMAVNYFIDLSNKLNKMLNTSQQFEGTIIRGCGEGKYYINKYNPFFRKHLGFVAYPGTLNLRITKKIKNMLLNYDRKVHICAFQTKNRSFGGIDCVNIVIAGSIDGAIVLPERGSNPPNTIELISKCNLRKTLGLKNGERLKCELK